MELTLMKGGTSHRIRKLWQRVVTKGGGDDGKWWRREAVKEGSDDEGEWWRREVVRKGSGDEGKWRGREVMMKGSGEEGNWQPWRGVVHDVARALFWGGSRSTKPCVFPCKVAAGDDERYLVCAAGAAAVGLSFFFCRSVTVASSCFGCACVCVVIGCFGICACRSHWNGCMMLQGLCFGEEAGARNLVFFRVKWLQATMKGTSSVRRVRLRSVYRFFCRSVTVASSCFGCACVCVVIGCFGICACRSHWNGCMMLQGLCFGEEAGARNLVFFRVKWLQATMKGTSSVRRVRLRSVYRFFFAAV